MWGVVINKKTINNAKHRVTSVHFQRHTVAAGVPTLIPASTSPDDAPLSLSNGFELQFPNQCSSESPSSLSMPTVAPGHLNPSDQIIVITPSPPPCLSHLHTSLTGRAPY